MIWGCDYIRLSIWKLFTIKNWSPDNLKNIMSKVSTASQKVYSPLELKNWSGTQFRYYTCMRCKALRATHFWSMRKRFRYWIMHNVHGTKREACIGNQYMTTHKWRIRTRKTNMCATRVQELIILHISSKLQPYARVSNFGRVKAYWVIQATKGGDFLPLSIRLKTFTVSIERFVL